MNIKSRWTANFFAVLLVFVLLFNGVSGVVGLAPKDFTIKSEGIESINFQGRVYQGEVGDESQPISGVTVSLWVSNNPEPASFAFDSSTTTDGDGWYGLNIPEGVEYYRIIESDPAGYQSVGATTVSGTIIDANTIEYVVPLTEKTLTGNKFWDQPLTWEFQGRVFSGEMGDESSPISGVTVSLFGANNAYPDSGILIESTTTNSEGWYGLEGAQGFEFYKIIEIDPVDYFSVGATTVDGVVQSSNWIEYGLPIEGKTLTGNKFWDQPFATPTPEPTGVNLVVNDVWPQADKLCFQIQNTGIESTSSNFITALYIDESSYAELEYAGELDADQRWNACFEPSWTCSEIEDAVSVITDFYDEISESNESDNGFEDVWSCDTDAPVFVTPPYVDGITTNSADIHWDTDEPAEGLVLYGSSAGRFPFNISTETYEEENHLTISGLDPATSYHFLVRVTDSSNNTSTSREVIFETLASSDTQNPEVILFADEELRDQVVITAEAVDNKGIERVEFYVDGVIKFTDYTPPYEMPLDSRRYANGEHQITARAFDLLEQIGENSVSVSVANPIDQTVPQVIITSPGEDQAVSGEIAIEANLSDDVGLLTAAFYVDGVYTAFEGFPNNPKSASVTFDWDTTGLNPGQSYRLGVMVFDTESKSTTDTVDVIVQSSQPPPPPDEPPDLVVVDHTISRLHNQFSISLTIKNEGDLAAANICIKDGLKGFQPLESAETSSYWDPKSSWGYAEICPLLSVPAGQERTYTYNAVPVLVYPNPPLPAVGWFIDLDWDSSTISGYHKYLQIPLVKTEEDETIAIAHALASMESNYIIATSPYHLAANYVPNYYTNIQNQSKDEFNTLLATMAELAWYKNGVLGYVNNGHGGTLNTLIKPGGDWLLYMKPLGWFPGENYLLIVGETNVITSYTSKGWDFQWSGGTVTDEIEFADSPIADTIGDKRPDWILGRVVGDSLSAITEPIRTSIEVYKNAFGYGYDLTHALSVSGTGNGEIKMIDGADDTEDLLDTRGLDCDVLHWSDYPTDGDRLSAFNTWSVGRDIVYLFAHGNINSLGPLQVGNLNGFGTTNPFVLGASCLTGDYVNGGFVEAMLNSGAGVYIGSTELSPMNINKISGKNLYTSTLKTNTAGRQFYDLERKFWGTGSTYRFWVMEYNYYGDPKYGSTPTDPKLLIASEEDLPPTNIDITLPDYAISTLDGFDYIEIPDGLWWFESGDYQIPFYQKTIEIPAGFSIQDVVLDNKADPSYQTGKRLPVNLMEITGSESQNIYVSSTGDLPPFAGRDFDWSISENPDGSSSLIINIYPFNYDPQTTNVTYYHDFHFNLDFGSTPVSITEFFTDEPTYAQGEQVHIEVGLENTGAEVDVGVAAVLRNANSGDLIDGYPIQLMENLKGKAAFSLGWMSTGFPAGEYEVELILKEPNGIVFDRQVTSFTLGYSLVEITSFSTSVDDFEIGDQVYLSLGFQNNGDQNASGKVVIRVLDDQGVVIDQFEHNYTGLAPSQLSQVNDLWDSTGLENGTYNLIAYVLYDSKVSEPEVIILDSEDHIFLPMITN